MTDNPQDMPGPVPEDTEALCRTISSNKDDYFRGPDGVTRSNFCKTVSKRLEDANRSISEATGKASHFCKEGCDHCCSQAFRITPAEVTAISCQLLEQPELLSRFLYLRREHEKTHGQRGRILTGYEEYAPITADQALHYFSLKIPCDFLDGGRCLIYRMRPLVCSSFVSFAPGRICALEPKGHVPPEARKSYHEANYWFQTQSKIHYPAKDVLILNWLDLIYRHLTRGDF